MTRLEEIRTNKGISKYRLAQLAGLTPTYINNIESGKRQMEDVTVRRIKSMARALEVDFTDLLD